MIFDNYSNTIYSIRESDLQFSGQDIYTSLKYMFLTGENQELFTTSTTNNSQDLDTVSKIIQSAETNYQDNQQVQ